LREQPIPWAYRVFFRQIGLDPDETRTPVEELALARLRHGGFRSANPTEDAMTVAIVETGIALQAFDDDGFDGPLGIRLSAPGEALDGQASQLPPGTLVIADADRPLGVLFGPLGERPRLTKKTRRVALAAIQVKGVPAIAIEEAFWTLSAVLEVG